METVNENNTEQTKPNTIQSLNDALWALFARIPDWSMSLLARFAVAGIFWRSGQTKVDENWNIIDFTFILFESEYALPLLSPKVAAYMATFAEHFFPILIVIGLATRFSVGALFIMTLVIQIFVYPASWPDHAVWAVAMLFVMSRGPGMLSLDHLIKKQFS